jgi:hypothetical protein
MVVVRHLGMSQSDRIVRLCGELGLVCGLERYDRGPAIAKHPGIN